MEYKLREGNKIINCYKERMYIAYITERENKSEMQISKF